MEPLIKIDLEKIINDDESLIIELGCGPKKIPGEHFTMICQRATGDEKYDELVEQAESAAYGKSQLKVLVNKIS